MKTAHQNILFSLILLIFAYSNASAGSLYAVKKVEEDAVLLRIDTKTLEANEVGPLYLPIRPADYSLSGMAWDPHSQTLLLALSPALMTIDLNTLRVNYLGTVEISFLSGLTHDCNIAKLYGASLSYFGGIYSFDKTLGAPERILFSQGDDQNFTGLTYNQAQDIIVGLKGLEGDLYLIERTTGGVISLLYDNPLSGNAMGSIAYDIDQNLYWSSNRDGELFSYDPANEFELTRRKTGLGDLLSLVYVHDYDCEPPQTSIPINYGMTDAWFDLLTAGQGFLITVYPELKQLFVAWFTYDSERPAEDVNAILGEPGHRWLTAQGKYEGDTAELTIYLTEGGVFDAKAPPSSTNPAGDGTMIVRFKDCNSGNISYEVSSIGQSGEIAIERVVLDKVPLCEQLNQHAQ